MIQCQNCGQVNNYGSNFCRFCGTRMVFSENQTRCQSESSYEINPPRPHVWKTDEFQIDEQPARKTEQLNRVQPPMNQAMPRQNRVAPPLAPNYRQPLAYGYRCPRCGTQNFPRVVRKISSTGWVVFAVLLAVFFPLFWIGLLIKEDVKICPVCNARIG